MRVAISGVTGLIGGALAKSLMKDRHEVIGLTRRTKLAEPMRTVSWDVGSNRFDASGLEGVDAVVHLAGEPVAQRWNAATKSRIRDSRVNGTRLLVEGLKSLSTRPKVLVSGSAVGYYGARGDESLTETSASGDDYLAEVCREWEAEAQTAEQLNIRCVLPRIGIVLSTHGGALKKMLTPFKLGVGGPVGDGKQYMSWIHIVDVVGILRYSLENESLTGPINATAPAPVTNAEFTKSLGRAVHRPAFLPAPGFALRLAFGEMADALLLAGQRVFPEKTVASGYAFRFGALDPALRDIVDNRR